MAKHKNIALFHRQLARWYTQHGRKDLPWRNTRDPYAIYVSEIMLQQTQVKTVLERYYFPFLQRFPTLKALAGAKKQDVLKAWQGLGYYNRAANLHKAANVILSEAKDFRSFVANAPQDDAIKLMSLPGIGRNTAHAIAAFAYQKPVPVMEANVKRVLCRIFALENPTEQGLWENAAALIDTKNPFDYNQAMMDIGAMVCTKRAPRCGTCPAAEICKGKTAPESYPAATIKKAVPLKKKHIVVLQNNQGEYFAKAREGKFLNGMYQFVEQETRPARAKMLGKIRQQYSHFTLEADVYLKEASGGNENWHSFSKLEKLPFSMAELKILKLLPLNQKRHPRLVRGSRATYKVSAFSSRSPHKAGMTKATA